MTILGHFLSLWFSLILLLNLVGFNHPDPLAFLAAMCFRRGRRSKFKVTCLDDLHSPAHSPSLLDLPELAVEAILSNLPAKSLATVACVSKELYKKSSCDLLWLPHVQSKWSRVAGPAAFEEWCKSCNYPHLEAGKADDFIPICNPFIAWPLSCLWTHLAKSSPYVDDKDHAVHSYRRWFITLEMGAFWFPAQVYNREHGHVGFLLSCYDAELRYDQKTDTFTARYPPHGMRSPLVEEGIPWQRLRAPPTPTTAHELYMSGSLEELHPGDHVEVQWRRNKKFPYGWWYGVVAHLETCDKDTQHCRCHLNDMIWLEFNQYAPGSRWRRTSVDRKRHTEKGDEAGGFYAGIRKLCRKEVSAWMQLWPREVLD